MKRIALIATLAFLSVGAALWVAQNFATRWEPQLRAELENRVGNALGARLRLGKISVSFLLRVALKDVELWDSRQDPEALVFRAKEVTLTASLLDLPRAFAHRNVLEGIGHIAIDSPVMSLSEEWIRQRLPRSSAAARMPLWFGVEWNEGTLQWKNPRAPRGVWTLYQAQGHFRIRGPRVDALVRGGLEQAESIQLHVTTLGKRWTAIGRVSGGDIPAMAGLIQHVTGRAALPQTWAAQGRFTLDMKCAGRLPFSPPSHFGTLLKEARLTLSNTQIQPGPASPSLLLLGSLSFKNGIIDPSGLSIKAENTVFKLSGQVQPFTRGAQVDLRAVSSKADLGTLARYAAAGSSHPAVSGVGTLHVSMTGPLTQSAVAVQAVFPQGTLWRWPFQDATLEARRAGGRWDITSSQLRLWGGTLSLKGSSAPNQTDLQVTGSEMALDALGLAAGGEGLRGRLNFSLKTLGTADPTGLRTTGSFWFEEFAWARASASSIRGDLDYTTTRFKLQGASEDQKIKLHLSGSRNADTLVIEQASAQLREAMSLSVRGTYSFAKHLLRLTLNGKNISLPQDVPRLQTRVPSVKGHVDLQGTLEGPLETPALKMDLQSQDFQAGSSPPSKAGASLRWSPEELLISLSHAKSSTRGTWRASRNGRRPWDLALTFTTAQMKADFKGKATTGSPPDSRGSGQLTYQGVGTVSALPDGSVWSIPARFKGTYHPADEGTDELQVDVPAVRIHGKPAEPFEAHLRWNRKALEWDSVRWGRSLTTQGSVRYDGERAELAGQLKVLNLNMAKWQSIFSPGLKEPVEGVLNGTFKLGGPLMDPLIQFSGKVGKGRWRTFRFETGVEGTWKNYGLEPVTLEGTFLTGGRFRFLGRVSPGDQTASGSLDLTQFELKPIGESLSFPNPLEGKVNGTLTVSGPLDQMRFAGHLEGTSLVYGSQTATPLKLESCAMDAKLEPSPDSPGASRLTLTQALAKTKEEEIRLHPGSFVEFSGQPSAAGPQEARLQIGTEIRNLHLGVFTLFGGLDMNGTWQIQPEGFVLTGELLTRSLYINDYQLEQGHVQASYYNRVLSFQPPREGPALVVGTVDFKNAPQLDFKNFAVTGRGHESLKLTGSVGPQKWNFEMAGEGLDIGTLGGLAGFPHALNGTANVNIRGLGDLDNPDVRGTLDIRDGRALGLDFQSGEATFAWQGQRMTFTRLRLSDPGRYTLSGSGIFPLATKTKKDAQDRTINFSLRLLDSNLGLLQSVSSEVKSAKGTVQALLQITGTTDEPMMRGSVRVKNGEVIGAHYFRHVRDFQLTAEFDRDKLMISDFRGKSGKGEFTGGGHIAFSGFEPKFYDLHVEVPSSKGIEITVPELAIPESPLAKRFRFLTLASQGDVKGRVTFHGPADAPVFMGQATISNGHFTFPPSTKNPPPPGFLEWIHRITWDATLRFADDAWFENELVEANVAGELTLKGPSRGLRVDGGLDIQKGQISYLGVQFDIRQARYEIHTNDAGSGIMNTPYVRGIADSRVQTVDPLTGQGVEDTITLTINYAPVHEIKPLLKSSRDPGLAQEKLLERVTQLEVENLTPQERTYLYQQQMVRLLDTSLATPLARNLLKRTGLVDQVRVSRVINPAASSTLVDPNNPAATQQDTATSLLAGTKYTVAKNLSSRLSLGYGLRFEQNLNPDLTNKLDLRSDVEMSYRFLSNIYLRGTFDLPSQTPGVLPERRVTIEPHWRFGWWGNTNKTKQKAAKKADDASAESSQTK